MKHYLSFGGGVNSVALYLLMEELGMEFEALFVNHGADYPETYEYLDYFISTGRPVTVLKPGYYIKRDNREYNSLYDYCWQKKMVPSIMARWCTKHFKTEPIGRYAQKPCFMHLGIDAGESKRARMSYFKGIENKWLLIEHGIDRDGCKRLIKEAGLDIPPKSGCFFCPFQRIAQWKELRQRHPELFCKAVQLERRNMEYAKRLGKKPMTIRNDGRPLDMLVNDHQRALWPEMDYPPCQCGL